MTKQFTISTAPEIEVTLFDDENVITAKVNNDGSIELLTISVK